MNLKTVVICGIIVYAVNDLSMKVLKTTSYMKGAFDAFHVMCKDNNVSELKIEVPFGKKHFDMKISK